MDQKRRWLVIYTRPRWEKKVSRLLISKGLTTYCPLNKVRRKWSDRFKIVEEPLFRSYVFVWVDDKEEALARVVEGVLNFVYWQGKPAVVRDSEIESIRKFMNEYQGVEVQRLDPEVNSKVKIRSGLLMEKEATVLRVLHSSVEVIIESLGYRLIAQVDKTNLQAL